MKKRTNKEYGDAILLYPGLTVRAGSLVLVHKPLKTGAKKPVDNFVEKTTLCATSTKSKHVRGVCLKNKQ